ncbi:DnaJ family domain-containing protein [Zhihengliuella salsuginis]|uniref:DnaJ homologue subfamily C member 28 conserved domain-containing protein n=1 Tax=Zhihengliuella salsuginis TaxID=578222 RepID=A0ABQ3GDD8_9MICC|nr:DUF1992 domain-containing protein [Zhihengliuella salsuginis]GHD02484.1 hypothetical protein GCM10008096_07660 [Zhihengliuella salsuginis]
MRARHDDEDRDGEPPLRDTDPLLRAARYQDQQDLDDAPAARRFEDDSPRVDIGPGHTAPEIHPTFRRNDDVGEVATGAVDQAVARSDFDNLAYAGKPLPNPGGTHDPDWWVKGLIERENISGLGPPAISLRQESAGLAERLDRLGSEGQVRDALRDFNDRVVEARRQLLGGPPVVTPTRDVDEEVLQWRQRRESAAAAADAERRRQQDLADRERAERRSRRLRRWIPWA